MFVSFWVFFGLFCCFFWFLVFCFSFLVFFLGGLGCFFFFFFFFLGGGLGCFFFCLIVFLGVFCSALSVFYLLSQFKQKKHINLLVSSSFLVGKASKKKITTIRK